MNLEGVRRLNVTKIHIQNSPKIKKGFFIKRRLEVEGAENSCRDRSGSSSYKESELNMIKIHGMT